jgi:3-methyladenine DNA glycosylase AlkD
LVDLTAPGIVGEYLQYKNKNKLYQLARMKNLWSRRISILACFAFIKNNDFIDALRLAKFHLPDQHDLMHKAVGWLLREIGKRDTKVLKQFLKINYQQLPRTTLRYAIERFDEKTRKKYLSAMLDSL